MEKRRQKGPNASTEENGQGGEIIVRSLKTWDKPFPPFSFSIEDEEIDGEDRLTLKFNLNPAIGDDKQNRVWNAIRKNYSDGKEFQRSDIEQLCVGISPDYIKKLLSEWAGLNRLEKSGFNRDTRYRLPPALVDESYQAPADA
jgi:hypothetical protein